MVSNLPANASSSYTFPGYNLSQPYPGTFLPDSKFTWDINVWGNVPYSNTSRIETWAEFRLGADEELVKSDGFEVDESWYFCGKAYGKPMSGNDNVNENCEGFVSDECLKALQAIASDWNYCDRVTYPKACEDEDFIGVSYGWKQKLHDYDGYQSETGRFDDGSKVSFAGLIAGDHERDNYTLYDETIREVAITVIGFGQTPKNNKTAPTEVLPGTLKCVAAKPQDGSRTFDEGSGSSRIAPPLIGALLVLMSFALMI